MRGARFALATAALLVACAPPTGRRSPPPPHASPPAATTSPPVSLSPAPATTTPVDPTPAPPPWTIAPVDEKRIDATVQQAIRRGDCPGAVVVITKDGDVLHRRAYGHLSLRPARVPMPVDAVFDLASLTKPLVTAAATMQLVERGRLSLDTKVAEPLPELSRPDTEAITVRHLLSHTSGLPAVNPLSHYRNGRDQAISAALGVKPLRAPGRRNYSDLGYIILGELVARVSGQALDSYAREHIFEPLEMQATFAPPDPTTVVPTNRNKTLLRGQVHDLRAAGLDGVAGHAGLFGTADDVTRFAVMLAGEGIADGTRVLAPSTVRAFATPVNASDPRHGLGYSLFADGISHTGFTGTYLWVHPETRATLVLLTSRLHPDEKGDVTELRQNLRSLALGAARRATRQSVIELGIDRLIADQFAPLSGRHVGLVTNHTGRASDGRRTADVLHDAPDISLVAIFSPEHGLAGDRDEEVEDGRDRATGTPVYSLYGERKRPSAEQLKGIDTLVFDVQDAGARFYTYVTTLGLVLEEATKHRLDVVVLDRPNPIGGQHVAGPVLDDDRRSFVGYHSIPVRHGMTVGELAKLFSADRQLVAPTVVSMKGWRRAMMWRSTARDWRPPSPNLRTPHAALLYPGVALVEATNVSVGRGTAHPFEVMGAPWIDAERLAESLRAARLDGLFFEPTSFTPQSNRHAGRLCHGVAFAVDDASRFDPIRLGVALALALRTNHRSRWRPDGLMTLLGDAASYRAILANEPLDQVIATWEPELSAFRDRRAAYLLYE